MKHLEGNKLLCALLAVVSVGMGVQTYYLVQLQRQLESADARTAASSAPAQAVAEDERADATPASPRAPLAAADPFAHLDQAEEHLWSLFDDLPDPFGRDFGSPWLGHRGPFAALDSFFGDAAQLGPSVDLRDRDDSYELTVDVPGADQADVAVRVEGDTLVVESSRSTTTETSEPGSLVQRERQFGRFERRLSLPRDADSSTLQTEFKDGVLKVTLDKRS